MQLFSRERKRNRPSVTGLIAKSKFQAYATVLFIVAAFASFASLLSALNKAPNFKGAPCWVTDLASMAGSPPCADNHIVQSQYNAQVRVSTPNCKHTVLCILPHNSWHRPPMVDISSAASSRRTCWMFLQVALLFLVRNQIPTEPIWSAFIAAAAELSLKHPVPAPAPTDPPFLPSSREATGNSPTCRGHYLAPTRQVEPAGVSRSRS